MLRAILKGKAGRVELEDGTSQSWREVFRKREDLLTAVFFGRLRYLSDAGEQKVLALLISKEAADRAGKIQSIKFWPKYSSPIKGQSWVEPDVLIECENAVILIEVKPPFGGDQYSRQWENEIRSFIHDQNDCDWETDTANELHFLALGRVFDGWKVVSEKLTQEFAGYRLSVSVREWQNICFGITALLLNEDSRDKAVYEDWMEAFNLFGLQKKLLSFDALDTLKEIPKDWSIQFSKWKPICRTQK